MCNSFSLWRIFYLFFIIIGQMGISACSLSDQVSLEIEAGYACDTLKEFAQQADIEIVYNASSVENITTNTIYGTMDPEDGLTLMLKGTLLIMEKDPKTGAFAVKKKDK